MKLFSLSNLTVNNSLFYNTVKTILQNIAMKILADAHIPFLKGMAEQFGETTYLPGDQFTEEVIKDKDALIVRTVTHFDEKLLKNSEIFLDLL